MHAWNRSLYKLVTAASGEWIGPWRLRNGKRGILIHFFPPSGYMDYFLEKNYKGKKDLPTTQEETAILLSVNVICQG